MDGALAAIISRIGYQFHDVLTDGFDYVNDIVFMAKNVEMLKKNWFHIYLAEKR